MNDAVINAAIQYIRGLFRDNAGGHDAEHSLRVYRTAMYIAEHEPDCDREIVALAEPRHAFLEQFLKEYDRETDGGNGT